MAVGDESAHDGLAHRARPQDGDRLLVEHVGIPQETLTQRDVERILAARNDQRPLEPHAHDGARREDDVLAFGPHDRPGSPEHDANDGALLASEEAAQDAAEDGADPGLASVLADAALAHGRDATEHVDALALDEHGVELELETPLVGRPLGRLRVLDDAAHPGAGGQRQSAFASQRRGHRGLQAVLAARGPRGHALVEPNLELRSLLQAQLAVALTLVEGGIDVISQVADRTVQLCDLVVRDAGAFASRALVLAHLHLEVDGLLADLFGPCAERVGLAIAGLEGLELAIEVLQLFLEALDVARASIVPSLPPDADGGAGRDERGQRQAGTTGHGQTYWSLISVACTSQTSPDRPWLDPLTCTRFPGASCSHVKLELPLRMRVEPSTVAR